MERFGLYTLTSATGLADARKPVTFPSMTPLTEYLPDRRARIDEELYKHLPNPQTHPQILHQAMRYAVLGGGKRIRPILCIAAAEAVGGSEEGALWPALALEILHSYTLVHDDLPCMDDDNLRRGQPACHIQFGEANAILAGDALLTLAFAWTAQAHPADRLVRELAEAAGHAGVIAGQVEDLAAEGHAISPEQLESIHRHKTGALLRAAVRMGGLVGGATDKELNALTCYGESVGLAFQIIDDLLDVSAEENTLGKPIGSDVASDKATYVKLHDETTSRQRATDLVAQALHALSRLPGNTDPLSDIAQFIVTRTF